MTKEERYEIFERYLRGTLNGLEQKEFESNLVANPEWQKELELHQGLHQVIGDKNLQFFEELVQESGAKYFEEKPKSSPSFFKLYGRKIAATAAILFLAVMSYFFLFPKSTPEQLFAEYFAPYNAPGTFRSEDLTSIDENFILALARYDEGEYGEAVQFFTKTLEKNPEKDIAIFLRGVSYLALDSLAFAEVDLKTVVADEESLFQEQGKWYLGLVYLGMMEKEKAKKIFEKMKRTDKIEELLLKIK
ncbi:MAG: tetratricopeptide repeat protein [Saprospiraceae bacterium]